jgi:hypothetical protein
MPHEAAIFVARTGWAKILKDTSKVWTHWQEAFDEDLVDLEQHWKPFPELVPFDRIENALATWELAEILALLDPAGATPLPADEPDAIRMLPRPKLTDKQRELFELLEYPDHGFVSDAARDRASELSDEDIEAMAKRCRESCVLLLGSSADIGRVPDWAGALRDLRDFCIGAIDSYADEGWPILVVGRTWT